jgi:hypothetical protein
LALPLGWKSPLPLPTRDWVGGQHPEHRQCARHCTRLCDSSPAEGTLPCPRFPEEMGSQRLTRDATGESQSFSQTPPFQPLLPPSGLSFPFPPDSCSLLRVPPEEPGRQAAAACSPPRSVPKTTRWMKILWGQVCHTHTHPPAHCRVMDLLVLSLPPGAQPHLVRCCARLMDGPPAGPPSPAPSVLCSRVSGGQSCSRLFSHSTNILL